MRPSILSCCRPLVLGLVLGCGDKADDTAGGDGGGGDGGGGVVDADGDGFPAEVDCDDDDPAVNPGADEVCDGADNDCTGEADEVWAVDAPFWYADFDRDGFGVTVYTTRACAVPEGYAAVDGDCDDFDAAVVPGATEVCDGIDNDCDGFVDGSFAEGQLTFYRDGDGDGFGVEDETVLGCEAPSGYAAAAGDCDDALDTTYPGAEEECDGEDNDCNGFLDDTCPVETDDADVLLTGADSLDDFGYDVSSGADIDGDGAEDLLVGAYGDDNGATDAGSAYLFLAPFPEPATEGDPRWAARIDGTGTRAYLGYETALVPDQDGDGYGEVLVTAYGAAGGGSERGEAWLFAGPVSGTLGRSAADARIAGASDGGDLGQYLFQPTGDLTGDGVGDWMVGAHAVSSNAGAVYVLAGPLGADTAAGAAAATVAGGAANDYVGYAAAARDFNGDGVADLAVGVSGDDAVAVFLGPLAGSLDPASADVRVTGPTGDAVGSNLAAGDMDGDGTADLLIGAKYNDDGGTYAGQVSVVPGPLISSTTLTAGRVWAARETADYQYLGGQYNSFAVRDVDADGTDDVFVGSYTNDDNGNGAGAAFLFYGPLEGEVEVGAAGKTFYGSGANEFAGYGLAIGDFNGAGPLDIAVGARGHNNSRGRVAVFFDGGLLPVE